VFKDVRTVIGDLDSKDVLLRESAIANVVLQCASADHEAGAEAIIEGLRLGPSGSGPGYLIHTSGTGILLNFGEQFGQYSSKVYDDVVDIKEITSLPPERWHRKVDAIVLAAEDSNKSASGNRHVKTAILCPPLIYGVGDGPVKTRSNQLPNMANAVLRHKSSFTVAGSKNIWRNVHVADLADGYVLLVEEALKEGGGKATWGAQGYYFTENGEHTFVELSQLLAFSAYTKGYISKLEVETLSPEEVKKLNSSGPAVWGFTSRGIASRLRGLGWKPFRAPVSEYVAEALEIEARSLGVSEK